MPDICPKCQKAVYAAEEKIAAKKKWHKMCLKCGMCNKMLDSTTLAEHEGEIFCKQCHGRQFGIKGYGFGGGAGSLNMDTGAQFGGKGSANTKPTSDQPTGGKVIAPSDGGCPRCGKRVYDAEKAIGCPDNLKYHKSCFRCKGCGSSLDSTTICSSKEDGEIYCKACYGKRFGPKGFGFGQGAGCLNMG